MPEVGARIGGEGSESRRCMLQGSNAARRGLTGLSGTRTFGFLKIKDLSPQVAAPLGLNFSAWRSFWSV